MCKNFGWYYHIIHICHRISASWSFIQNLHITYITYISVVGFFLPIHCDSHPLYCFERILLLPNTIGSIFVIVITWMCEIKTEKQNEIFFFFGCILMHWIIGVKGTNYLFDCPCYTNMADFQVNIRGFARNWITTLSKCVWFMCT